MQISTQAEAFYLRPAARTAPPQTEPTGIAGLRAATGTAFVGSRTVVIDDRGPDQILAEDTAAQTGALGHDLDEALRAAHIGTDQPIRLQVGRYGTVETTDGRKDRIEQFFRDRPELSRRLKDVSALNTLVAMNKLYRWHETQQKAARTEDERGTARDRFYAAGMQLQSLSGIATLQDGRLNFAVQAFADTLIAER
jgi:hypothetical protein